MFPSDSQSLLNDEIERRDAATFASSLSREELILLNQNMEHTIRRLETLFKKTANTIELMSPSLAGEMRRDLERVLKEGK